MIRNTLIAAAALASVAAIGSTQASAKVNLNIHVGVPGGHYGSGPYYPVYDDYYDNDCHYKVVWKKKWSHKHHTFIKYKKKVLVCY
jgi:hypothetical protein